MNEIPFKNKCLKAMRDVGAITYPLIASERSPHGWPDVLVVHWKWSGLIEFKGTKTPVKPVQLLVLNELNKRKFPAHLVREHEGGCLIDGSHTCSISDLLLTLARLRDDNRQSSS